MAGEGRMVGKEGRAGERGFGLLKAKNPPGSPGGFFAKVRDPDLGVRLGLRKLGHALQVLDGAALLEQFHALEALEDVTLRSGGGGAGLETVVLGHGRKVGGSLEKRGGRGGSKGKSGQNADFTPFATGFAPQACFNMPFATWPSTSVRRN